MLFLTSQMLRKTWVCSGCRVYLYSTVQHLSEEFSRSKITNNYGGTKDEYCPETKTQSGRNLEVTALFICNAHNALGWSCRLHRYPGGQNSWLRISTPKSVFVTGVLIRLKEACSAFNVARGTWGRNLFRIRETST
jgi:hypothetical protein